MWTYFQNKFYFPKAELCSFLKEDEYILSINKNSIFQEIQHEEIKCDKLFLLSKTGKRAPCTVCEYQILNLLNGQCEFIEKRKFKGISLSTITLTLEIPFFLTLKNPNKRFPNFTDIKFSPLGILYNTKNLLKDYDKMRKIFNQSGTELNFFMTKNIQNKSNDFDLFVLKIRGIYKKLSHFSIKELEEKISKMEI